ncbi:MAG: polysaccharide deacetylase family protein [Hyphomicrobiales bacterium]
MQKIYMLVLLLYLGGYVYGQKVVSVTIDDVPRVNKFAGEGFESGLLDRLDVLGIPVAVFINEGLIYKTDSVVKNFDLLNRWVQRDYVTLGNHTYGHLRYSEVGYERFRADIEKGEAITRALSEVYDKELKYFRFPYNDLGGDSLQKQRIESYLEEKGYIIAPFTVESSDWVFNYMYEYYLKHDNRAEAERIAETYISVTLEYFRYFDSLSVVQYDRHISQIYLCHDNSINTDCIGVLVERLKEEGYTFVGLAEAMKDKVYSQENNYYKKWGVSWFYRWMEDKIKIRELMQGEPDIMDIYKEYQEIQGKS